MKKRETLSKESYIEEKKFAKRLYNKLVDFAASKRIV